MLGVQISKSPVHRPSFFYDTDSTIASFSLAIASSLLAGINQYAQLRIRG